LIKTDKRKENLQKKKKLEKELGRHKEKAFDYRGPVGSCDDEPEQKGPEQGATGGQAPERGDVKKTKEEKGVSPRFVR